MSRSCPSTLASTMIELRPYQKQAIEQLRNGSILVGGVGTGKTATSLAYYILKECNGEYKNGIFK